MEFNEKVSDWIRIAKFPYPYTTVMHTRDEHGSGLDRTGSEQKLILAGSGLDRIVIFLKIGGSGLDRTEKIFVLFM